MPPRPHTRSLPPLPASALHPGNYPTPDPAHAHPRPWTCLISHRHLFHARIGPAPAEDGSLPVPALSLVHTPSRPTPFETSPQKNREKEKRRRNKRKETKKEKEDPDPVVVGRPGICFFPCMENSLLPTTSWPRQKLFVLPLSGYLAYHLAEVYISRLG